MSGQECKTLLMSDKLKVFKIWLQVMGQETECGGINKNVLETKTRTQTKLLIHNT